MENFGAYLKAHREKKSIRLEEIASITKIHLKSLEMMEKNEFRELPPEPFIRGFITAYAKYVGIDPKEALAKYREEMAPQAAAPTPAVVPPQVAPEAPPVPVVKAERPTPSKKEAPKEDEREEGDANDLINAPQTFPARKMALGVGIVGMLLVVGGLIYIGKKNASPTPIATQEMNSSPSASEKQVVQSVAAAIAKQGEDKNAQATTEAPRDVASPNDKATAPETAPVKPADDVKHEVVIEGKERTWIKVVVDEEPPIEYFLPEGETATYKAKEKIKVVLGNSAGSKVTHNGTAAPGVKFQGTIRSYIFPDNARFPQDAPSKRSPSSDVIQEPEKSN